MAYIGLLKGEKEHDFTEIRNAIWFWEYKRTVTALLMPHRVFEQLRWKAKRDKLNSPEWTGHGERHGKATGIAIYGVPVFIDERVTGIEYEIAEDRP